MKLDISTSGKENYTNGVKSSGSFFPSMNVKGFLLVGLLLASIVSTAAAILPASLSPAYASHEDISITVENIVYQPEDEVFIEGEVADPDNDIEEAQITVFDPSNDELSDVDNENIDVDTDDGTFDFSFILDDNADEGRYKVVVEYGNADDGISFFEVDDRDDDNNDVLVETSDDTYSPGDTVEISGSVPDPSSETEVDITIYDPDGIKLDDDTVELDNDDEFTYDNYDLEDNADHGRYSVKAEYDNQETWAVFEVEEDSSSDPIIADTNKNTYEPGETVELTGEVNKISGVNDVQITVEDPDNVEIIDDEATVSSSGDFNYKFDLDDNADEGTYTITITYDEDDKEVTFTVDESGAVDDTLTNTGGVTVDIDKTSYLAGEIMKITGKVKTIAPDELVYIHIVRPAGTIAQIVQTEVESDKSYSYDLKLKSDLTAATGYKVKVTYDIDEVAEERFSITGKVTTGPPITVKTDKADYSSGETIEISGKVSADIIETGQKVLIRVWNPEGAAYRFDPVATSSDGSYSYDMKVGGDLGLPGEYDVIASYGEDVEAKTTFNFGEITSGKINYNLRVDDETYPITYEVAEGSATVKSMILKVNDKSIVISLEGVTEPGQIVVELPREVIDSKSGQNDTAYLVTTSDLDTGTEEATTISEDSTSDKRILIIDYDQGTDLIEISGTQVVPEFGEIAMIILGVTMMAIIAMFARGRFGMQTGLGSLFGKKTQL